MATHANNWPLSNCAGQLAHDRLRYVVMQAMDNKNGNTPEPKWDVVFYAARCAYSSAHGTPPPGSYSPPTRTACGHVVEAQIAAAGKNWNVAKGELNHGAGGQPSASGGRKKKFVRKPSRKKAASTGKRKKKKKK